MSIVPITFWTSQADLNRFSQQPAKMRDRMFIGLPFQMKDDQRIREQDLSQNYVVLPLSRFFDPQTKKEAARIQGIVTRTVIGNADRNAGWAALLANPEIRHLSQSTRLREAWSYMLIETILRERPAAYLSGSQHLADFFAERFQLEFGLDLRPPLTREMFHRHLLADRALLDASLNLKMQLAFRQQQIISQLEGMQIIGETYMEVMIVLAGLLTGVTGALIIDLILEAFIGLLQFMFELKKAESDGIITEEEAFGSWFALAGVFIPFTRVAPGFLRTLSELSLTVVGVAAILLQLITSLLRAVLGMIEALTADELGFDGYAQYDPLNTIFIPA